CLFPRFPRGLASLIAVLLAVPMALVSALERDKAPDIVIRSAFQIGLSMPVFYIGIVLLTFLAARLHWFPVGGFGNGFGEHLVHLFLPALTLALSLSAILRRTRHTGISGVPPAD